MMAAPEGQTAACSSINKVKFVYDSTLKTQKKYKSFAKTGQDKN